MTTSSLSRRAMVAFGECLALGWDVSIPTSTVSFLSFLTQQCTEIPTKHDISIYTRLSKN